MKMRVIWLGGLALALAMPVSAQDNPAWRPVDAQTGAIRDVDGLEQLAKDFPDSGSVRLRLLQAQLGESDTPAVLASLEWLNERGYVFSEGAQAQIPNLVGEEHAARARSLLLPSAEVIEASELVAEVPAEAGLIESVYSPDGMSIFVATSVTEKALYLSEREGAWTRVAIPGAGDLSGIVSTSDESAGFVASSNLDDSESGAEFSGLIGLTGDFENPVLIPSPGDVTISDLSIGLVGTVFASDPLGGGVYAGHIEAEALETLVKPGTFRSPQGSAVSEDGDRLYLSDYRYGLAVVDLDSRQVFRLSSDVPVVLDGVDGLWLHEGELIAVQNGTSPMRISAFTLSQDGMRITAARVLEQAHTGWTEPLGGNISNDALVYVATGQWDRYENGALREGLEAIPTEIRRLPLK